MSESTFLTSEPQQKRSQASFERVIESTIQLLEERGNGDFSVTDVGQLAKASIGSIYGRFSAKDDLLRAAQVRINQRLEAGHDEFMARANAQGHDLASLVSSLVGEMAEFLKQRAPLLRAVMSCASTDMVMAQAGELSYRKAVFGFRAVLLKHSAEIRHPNPEQAADLCFTIAYGTVARHLGLGMLPAQNSKESWIELKEGLCDMCLAYLRTEPVAKSRS